MHRPVTVFLAAVTVAWNASELVAQEQALLRLGDCTIFVSPSRRTFIARRGQEYFYGTLAEVVRVRPAEQTGYAEGGVLELAFDTVRRGDVEGILVRCDRGRILYSEMAESAWDQLPNGRDTTVPIYPLAGEPASKRRPPDPCAAELGQAAGQPEAVYHDVVAVEGERVPEDAVHVVLQSVLVEAGRAFQLMSQVPQNIQQVRANINGYIAGYFIEAEKADSRWRFRGATKAYRTTRLGGISVWPPIIYPESRREAIRRAQSPVSVRPSEPCDEMHNLRLYIYPIKVGHDGKKYVTEPSVLAFFVDPRTGRRMTLFFFRGKLYGAVSPTPLRVVSKIYVQDVLRKPAGPLGIGTAYVPIIFYSKEVDVMHEPFTQDNPLYELIAQVLSAQGRTVEVSVFRSIAREMSRYTGGGFLGK